MVFTCPFKKPVNLRPDIHRLLRVHASPGKEKIRLRLNIQQYDFLLHLAPQYVQRLQRAKGSSFFQ